MANFFSRWFGRGSSPDEGGAPERPAEPRTTFIGRHGTATYVRSELPKMSVEHAYGYGQVDGTAGVSSEHYQAYIGWSLEEERLQRLLTEAEERLHAAEARYVHTRDLLPTIAARTQEQHAAELRRSALGEEIHGLDEAIERVEGERRQKASRGSLFSGTLYLSVALIFVLADVIVARQIVADALKFTKGELFGINESWLFALGLAMISVLLKPVYDRLVEEKYLDGTGRRTYAWVMIGVSFFALATLFVMGAFRSEAFALQSQIDSLLRTNGSPDEIRRLGDTLASSRLGGWANVLSGMLFAVAGAVSLGMGSRHFQDYWQIRRRLARESERLQARRDTVRSESRHLGNEMATRSAEIDRLTVEWLESAGPEHEAHERDQRRRERDALLVQMKGAARHKLGSVYQDGYNLGYLGHSDNEQMSKQRRPYLALRRALRLSQLRAFVRAEANEPSPPEPAPPAYTRSEPWASTGGPGVGVDALAVPKIYRPPATLVDPDAAPSASAVDPEGEVEGTDVGEVPPTVLEGRSEPDDEDPSSGPTDSDEAQVSDAPDEGEDNPHET